MTNALNLLNGQVAIVTGGAQGIGLAVVERLLASGASVMIADVGVEQAQASARNLNAADRVAAQRCDVTKMADNENLVKACLERFGRLDILVNNAGITRDSYIAKMPEADFDAVVGVSLKGAWLGTRAVATLFRDQRSGVDVFLAFHILRKSVWSLALGYCLARRSKTPWSTSQRATMFSPRSSDVALPMPLSPTPAMLSFSLGGLWLGPPRTWRGTIVTAAAAVPAAIICGGLVDWCVHGVVSAGGKVGGCDWRVYPPRNRSRNGSG